MGTNTKACARSQDSDCHPQSECSCRREATDVPDKGEIWPLIVGDDDPRLEPRDGGRLSLNTKAFLTMGGTGLAAALVFSPLILFLDAVSVQTYIFLSCLMALASLAAGLANYQIVLRGVHGIVRKVGERAGIVRRAGAREDRRPINRGAIDTVDLLMGDLVGKARSEMEARMRVEQDAILAAISSLAAALEARDPYTRTHSRNVAHFAAKLADKMGLDEAQVDEIHLAGQLHDIGKIGVRDDILLKPGRLTQEEFSEIKKHPDLSVSILRPLRHLEGIRTAIRHHHEEVDGAGYPEGLRGEDIPLTARIMAVIDVFDAMISDRPYRRALSFEEALDELKRMSGAQLDPTCVCAFLELVNEDPELREMRDRDCA